MNLYYHIFTFYQYFFSKIIRYDDYMFIPNKQQNSLINNFIANFLNKEYSHSVGTDFLFNFFAYNFEYWHNKGDKFGGRKVMINMVLGSTAIERWKNKNEHALYFSLDFCKKNKIFKSEIDDIINFKEGDYSESRFEKIYNIERKRFLNTDKGFLNCISFTNLYNENCEACLECKFSIDCRKMKHENSN